MTICPVCGIITLAADIGGNTERYRSGHNEAVLKTVCPQGRVGSNPTLSASNEYHLKRWYGYENGYKPLECEEFIEVLNAE